MSELDKTIEELEAEVLAELEEASEKPLDDGTSGSKKTQGWAPITLMKALQKLKTLLQMLQALTRKNLCQANVKTLAGKNMMQLKVTQLLVKLPVAAP